jgi:hypothetical protein
MKAKKLKVLLNQINSIAKRDIKDIKGLKKTNFEASPGHPLILLPTRGKYCLPEVKIINKIITSLDPTKLTEEARKINFQAGILLISVLKNPDNPNYAMVLVHTPYGCCVYDVFIDTKPEKPIFKEIKDTPFSVSIDDEDLKDKFVLM